MGKFVIKKTNTGYTFSLKAGNGEVICTGGEVFNTLASCQNSIESVRKSAAAANIEDQTVEGFEKQIHPKFEIYLDKKGESAPSQGKKRRPIAQAKATPQRRAAKTASKALSETPQTPMSCFPRNNSDSLRKTTEHIKRPQPGYGCGRFLCSP